MSTRYKLFAALVLSAYAWMGLTGRELGWTDRRSIPENVRQSAAGWRSFHFWHAGVNGGK